MDDDTINGHQLTKIDVSDYTTGTGHFIGTCSCKRWKSNVTFYPSKIDAWWTQHALAAEPHWRSA